MESSPISALCATSERQTRSLGRSSMRPDGLLGRHSWMNLTEAAHRLGVSARTLPLAVERGEIEAQHPLPDGPWVFRRVALETEATASFVARVRRRSQEAAIPDAHRHPSVFRAFHAHGEVRRTARPRFNVVAPASARNQAALVVL